MQYTTDMNEGIHAETVTMLGANGDRINAFLARPLGDASFLLGELRNKAHVRPRLVFAPEARAAVASALEAKSKPRGLKNGKAGKRRIATTWPVLVSS